MEQRYVIYGQPYAIYINKPKTSTKIWNELNQARMKAQNQLYEQHQEKPLYGGSLSLTAQFYFPLNRGVKKGQLQTGKPSILDLCRFILEVGKDVLFKDCVIISHMNCYKYYDQNPRVEIIILEEK